jgi:molecular chaperone HtpG
VDPRHIGLLNEERLTELIRLYADLLSVPIYLGYSRTPVNTMNAPWHRAWEGEAVPEAEYREFARRRFQDVGILDIIPVSIVEDEGRFKVGGVLIIPKQPLAIVREHGDAIVYVRRMFVCKDDRTVLPEWAKFVKGIVESPNLRETTSRESVRRDENLIRVQQALGQHILEWLARKSEDDPRMFREIVTNHNLVIKAWALVSDELFDRIKDIVLFDTDVGYMNLPRYFEQSRLIRRGKEEAQQENDKRYIYYFATPGGVGQHAFLFQARGVRVIDAQFFPEEPFLKKYAERHPDVELRRLDVGGEYIFEELRPKEAKWIELEEAYADRRIEARVVRYEPQSIPAVLIFPEQPSYEQQARQLLDDPDVSPALKGLLKPLMEELEKGRKQKISGAGVLYLNADNDVIQQLAQEYPRREDVEEVDVLTTIYNNALMLSAPRSLTLENARRIFDSNNRTIRALISKINEVRELRQRALAADPAHMQALEAELHRLQAEVSRLQEENQRLTPAAPVLPAVRTACFARPYRPEFAEIEDAIKRVFRREMGVRLETVVEKPEDLVVWQNIQAKIRNSHFLVADITGANPNVLIEVGYAMGAGKPVVLIQRQDDDTRVPFDVQPFLRLFYTVVQATDGRKVVALLSDELERAKDAIFEKTPGLREAASA